MRIGTACTTRSQSAADQGKIRAKGMFASMRDRGDPVTVPGPAATNGPAHRKTLRVAETLDGWRTPAFAIAGSTDDRHVDPAAAPTAPGSDANTDPSPLDGPSA